jgi:hypothetical protein
MTIRTFAKTVFGALLFIELALIIAALAECPAPRSSHEECSATCGKNGVLEVTGHYCSCHPPCKSEQDDD